MGAQLPTSHGNTMYGKCIGYMVDISYNQMLGKPVTPTSTPYILHSLIICRATFLKELKSLNMLSLLFKLRIHAFIDSKLVHTILPRV